MINPSETLTHALLLECSGYSYFLSHVKDHRYSHNISPYFPDLTNFFVRTIFKTNLERAIVKLCSVKATKSDGENVVTQLNEQKRRRSQRVQVVYVNKIKSCVYVCVIVYCLLGLCDRAETRKDEEMAENDSHVTPKANVIRSEDEERREELYPNTVTIVINFARKYK